MLYFVLFHTIWASPPIHSLSQYIVSVQAEVCNAQPTNISIQFLGSFLILILHFIAQHTVYQWISGTLWPLTLSICFLMLSLSFLKKPSLIEHHWPESTTPPSPKPISYPSLPCNLRAVWFLLLPKLCVFNYIVP